MNPINVINQEFARRVVEQWSDEAAIRQREQGADESRVGISAAMRALVLGARTYRPAAASD
jgi:hypothetical protein